MATKTAVPDPIITDQDRMDPAYCPDCHSQVARNVLDAVGVCAACWTRSQELIGAKDRSEVTHVDTGLGVCLGCKSRNIREVNESASGTQSVMMFGAILLAAGGFVSKTMYGQTQPELPLVCWIIAGAFLVGCLFVRGRQYRICNECGQKWQT